MIRTRINQVGEALFHLAAALAGFGLAMNGIVVLIRQVMGYLKGGYWTAMSLLDGLRVIGFAWSEDEWIGLQRIVNLVPLWISLVVIGSLLPVFAQALTQTENRPR